MSTASPSSVDFVKITPRAQTLRSLRSWIEQGLLPVGERLPPEQVLAEKLQVSRTTVRAALDELEKEGLLRPHERCGRIVAGTRTPGDSVLVDTVAILTDAWDQALAEGQHQRGWNSEVRQGAVEAISHAGLHALALHPDRLSGDLLRKFIAEKPSGVIALRRVINSTISLQTLVAMRENGIPVVVSARMPDTEQFDTVIGNQEAGSYALTRWLIAQGRRRILRLWSARWNVPVPLSPGLVRRNAGYERAVREAGLEILPPLEFRSAPQEVTRTAEEFDVSTHLMASYLWPYLISDAPIDAIIAISDGVTYAAAAACRLAGRLPGRDVLLVGYDNNWADAPERQWETSVPAATIDKRNVDWGRAMVDLLLARRQAPPGAPPMHRMIEPKLVVVGEGQDGTPGREER